MFVQYNGETEQSLYIQYIGSIFFFILFNIRSSLARDLFYFFRLGFIDYYIRVELALSLGTAT